METLTGKCILLGITGGIAAYKMANVASALTKAGADVHVVMTKNAQQFITPLTFETLTHNACVTDTFDRSTPFEVTHISLAKAADLILVAPATADIIAKMANGIADDMLTTVVLAASCPKLVSPAMNTAMLKNPITQENLQKLQRFGFTVIEPASGHLACGDSGMGKMPEPAVLIDRVERVIARDKNMEGLTVTVTAGPTEEALDPVRYLTNHSSGKMGYAIAREAVLRGADVNLISGPTALPPVSGATMTNVVSAEDMYQAVAAAVPKTDILVMAAAVADYRPAEFSLEKIKKTENDFNIPAVRTTDILGSIAGNKPSGLYICGFSMETSSLLENSRKKLEKKQLDMIAANSLKVPGAGFGVSTNVVTIITEEKEEALPLMSKHDVAGVLLDRIMEYRQ